jgi:hypothetical protein
VQRVGGTYAPHWSMHACVHGAGGWIIFILISARMLHVLRPSFCQGIRCNPFLCLLELWGDWHMYWGRRRGRGVGRRACFSAAWSAGSDDRGKGDDVISMYACVMLRTRGSMGVCAAWVGWSIFRFWLRRGPFIWDVCFCVCGDGTRG